MGKELLPNGTWLAIDNDGTQWICTKEPFSNGLGKWFVELKYGEGYEDFMKKVIK